LNDLYRYVVEGAEILSAKLLVGSVPMRFDALSYRISGLKLEAVKEEHWTMDLDRRLEQIAGIFELLDTKYAAVKERLGPPETGPLRAAERPAESEGSESAEESDAQAEPAQDETTG
jgi:hypothetical protein